MLRVFSGLCSGDVTRWQGRAATVRLPTRRVPNARSKQTPWSWSGWVVVQRSDLSSAKATRYWSPSGRQRVPSTRPKAVSNCPYLVDPRDGPVLNALIERVKSARLGVKGGGENQTRPSGPNTKSQSDSPRTSVLKDVRPRICHRTYRLRFHRGTGRPDSARRLWNSIFSGTLTPSRHRPSSPSTPLFRPQPRPRRPL